MEISDVRRQLAAAIDRARKASADRRQRADASSREYETFLADLAVPLVRQLANVLKAGGYGFTVITPGGSVKLVSDKSADEYLEILFDAAADEPIAVVHSQRKKGRRMIEKERPLASEQLATLSEQQLLTVLIEELEPLLVR